MFTKRLVSGIILVILAIIIVGKGGALLYGVTALISLIGLFELYRVLKIEKNAICQIIANANRDQTLTLLSHAIVPGI